MCGVTFVSAFIELLERPHTNLKSFFSMNSTHTLKPDNCIVTLETWCF